MEAKKIITKVKHQAKLSPTIINEYSRICSLLSGAEILHMLSGTSIVSCQPQMKIQQNCLSNLSELNDLFFCSA